MPGDDLRPRPGISPGIPGQLLDALAAWDAQLRAAGQRPATRTARRRTVAALYAAAGLDQVVDLDAGHVGAYLGRVELAAASRRAYALSVRAWVSWAGLSIPVAIPRAPRGLPRPARAAGIRAAMLAAPAPVRAWIALGAYAGLRAGEVARLRGDDVDLQAGWLRIEGKGGQLGTTSIPTVLARELSAYVARAGGGPLWRPVRPDQVSGRAGRYLREHDAGTRFHQLRHYYGTAVYQSSGDILKAQRALRHSSPATTTIYALLTDDDLRAAVEAAFG